MIRKCPFSGKENQEYKYYCESCDSYMGSYYTGGPSPEASSAFKEQMAKEPNGASKTPKSRKTSRPEYVQLYHGPKVKKSTAQWLERKQQDANRCLFVLICLGLLLALA